MTKLQIVYQIICEIKLYVLSSHLVQHLGQGNIDIPPVVPKSYKYW